MAGESIEKDLTKQAFSILFSQNYLEIIYIAGLLLQHHFHPSLVLLGFHFYHF